MRASKGKKRVLRDHHPLIRERKHPYPSTKGTSMKGKRKASGEKEKVYGRE